jgi:hypothetical protein
MNPRFAATATTFLLIAAGSIARAEPMDPALERLVTNPECRTDKGKFTPDNLDPDDFAGGSVRCLPDDAAFKKMINQYGFAFAPSAMHAARTTGVSDLNLSIEAQYTKIDDSAYYWEQGTQGPVDTTSNEASIRNNKPQSMLQLYSLKARKGFSFGLEVTGVIGFMPKTSILSGGADVRFALLEGFRTGMAGILPDVSIGGGVRTITGAEQFQLTVASLDAQISKPLPILESSVLTPYIGYQYIWIFGDSGLIDLTPGTDALQYCDYQGQNVPGSPGAEEPYDGQPVCDGSSADFNNNVVFEQARLERQRLLAGLNYRFEMLMVGGQFMFDLIDPADAQNTDEDQEILEGEPKQWTLAFELGAIF